MRLHRATFGLVAVAALSGTSALASLRAGSAAAPAAAKAEPGNKQSEAMVCRKLTVSGSRMPRRVCATTSDWEDLTKRAAQGLKDEQMDSDRRSLVIPDNR